jgi:hypothetical protein
MLRQSPRAQGVPFDTFTSYLHSFELVQTQKGIITVGGDTRSDPCISSVTTLEIRVLGIENSRV